MQITESLKIDKNSLPTAKIILQLMRETNFFILSTACLWICPECGSELDRDINAAINIVNRWCPGDCLENT